MKIGTYQQKLEKLKPENRSVKIGICQQKLERLKSEKQKLENRNLAQKLEKFIAEIEKYIIEKNKPKITNRKAETWKLDFANRSVKVYGSIVISTKQPPYNTRYKQAGHLA